MDLWSLSSATLLAAASEGASEGAHHGPSFLGVGVYFGLVLIVIFTFLSMAKKGLSEKVFKRPATQLLEQVYLFIENLCLGIIGPHGRKYIPMIMTFWLVIFIGNLMALFMPTSPTADLGFNLGMALTVIGYVQWEGMKANGVLGHFKHFAGPKLPISLSIVTVLLFMIELVSEVMKNVSLSLRLFGNIDGGHRAAEAMNSMGIHVGEAIFGWTNVPFLEAISIPFGAFLLPIKLLTVVVQALIFCLLSCVYLSLVTHHEDDYGHEGGAAHAH